MTYDVIAAARRRTRRRAGALTVAALILAALTCPAAQWASTRDGDDPTSPSPTSPALPTATSGAGLLPADVIWVRVAGVDLPTTPATGPARVEAGLARGFTDTRAGAVVAALHLLVRTTAQVGPEVFEPTLAEQVTGEHAAAMRAFVADSYARAAAELGIADGQPLGDLPATVVGARVDAYTQTHATLSMLTCAVDATGTTRYAATTVDLIYLRGDWRLVAPPDGRWDTRVRLIDLADTAAYPPIRGR